jgi:hypothetical protein
MKFRLDYIAFPVFLATLAFNCWQWGGAAQINDLGPVIAASAAREAPVVQTYGYLGRKTIELLGWQDSARAAAEETFAPARERLLAEPALAMDDLFNENFSSNQVWLTRTHWICPLSLLLALIGWWMRPKKIQTIKTGARR